MTARRLQVLTWERHEVLMCVEWKLATDGTQFLAISSVELASVI